MFNGSFLSDFKILGGEERIDKVSLCMKPSIEPQTKKRDNR